MARRFKMKIIAKKRFSMVEVALAIGILAVGAATVITLFPTGIKQTRDSIGQNYSAIFADDTYAYIASMAKDPNSWKSGGGISTLPVTQPSSVVTSSQGLTKISGTDIMSTANNGVFVISKGSSAMQDFQAQVLVWGKDIPTTAATSSLYAITSGAIGISPTGNEDSFDLTKTDGTHFDRNSIQTEKNNSAYNAPGQIFQATNIKMRAKGISTVVVNGQSIDLQKNNDVTFTAPAGDPIVLNIYKTGSGAGQWYITITGGTSTTISNDNGTIIPNLPPPSSNPAIVGKGINVEISWPLIQADYAKRSMLKYYFEVYNMNR